MVYCNFLNNINTSFLTEDNLKNIFYTRTNIDGIISGITNTINTKSIDNRSYTTEIFTNSSNYTNEEILNERQRWKREMDELRTKELIERGYKILRLWEFEIRKMDINCFNNKLNKL
ncbi:MAG: hypothetical protein KGD67_12520 [Candidatus Lokiarchaeota archaeon]|nr:hypothetical protein [Candidatus Lokiarchaeota archaeon]